MDSKDLIESKYHFLFSATPRSVAFTVQKLLNGRPGQCRAVVGECFQADITLSLIVENINIAVISNYRQSYQGAAGLGWWW